MLDSIVKLLIGDIQEKRVYKQFMKRVNSLPKDYRFVFRKIQHYMYSVGSFGTDMTMYADITIFTSLLELFEASADDGKQVLDVIGSDAARFTDEFMSAYLPDSQTIRKKINAEITCHFKKEGK